MLNIQELDQIIIDHLAVQDIRILMMTSVKYCNGFGLKSKITKSMLSAGMVFNRLPVILITKNLPIILFEYYYSGEYNGYGERSIITGIHIYKNLNYSIDAINSDGLPYEMCIGKNKLKIYNLLVNLYYHNYIIDIKS